GSRGHARGDEAARWRSEKDQSSGAVRSRDRPLGAGGSIWLRVGVRSELQDRVRAQRRALRVFTLGQKAFSNFRVVPPDTGICHQVNLEYLGQVTFRTKQNGAT